MKQFFSGYCFKLNLNISVGNISKDKLHESLRKDGRKLGNFAEQILLSEFDNLVSSPNGNSKFDLLELPKAGGARAWEVKTVSEGNSCSFIASKYKGVGRVFDNDEHNERMKNLTGYIVFDVSRTPLILVKGFEISALKMLKCEKSMSRKILENELLA
jgi:hypothetical protein